MKDIKALFQMALVLVFLIGGAWVVSQVVPQIQTAANLPARIQADNARTLAEIGAAPTFIALQVQATRTAIENEQTITQASASAQMVQAQGNADSARMTAATWQTLVSGGLLLLAVGLLAFVGLLFFQTHATATTARKTIELAAAHGATLVTADNQTFQFPRRDAQPQLPPGQTAAIPEQQQSAAPVRVS